MEVPNRKPQGLVSIFRQREMGAVQIMFKIGKMRDGLGVGVAIMYIIIAVIAFFPFLFILRFANQMKAALHSNDQDLLNSSFQNLKI